MSDRHPDDPGPIYTGPSWARWTLAKYVSNEYAELHEFTEEELVALRQEAAGVVAHLDTMLMLYRQRRAETERPERDRLLAPEEAAHQFGVTRRWLLDHADDIPGSKRLSRKIIRFSERGVSRFLMKQAAKGARA